MKTRVIRYWHETDWLYKVEKYVQVTKQDTFIIFGGFPIDYFPSPVVGSWRWDLHIVSHGVGPGVWSFSREHALLIAERLAKSEPVPELDVVAEYGE